MKKLLLICGLIAGVIVSTIMAFNAGRCSSTGSYDGNLFIGYASMVLAFSLIFVGVKNYRDKYNGGSVSFGKAFRIGLWITLIASSIYVLVWLVDYYFFIPDFMDKYSAHMIQIAEKSGLSPEKMVEKRTEMAKMVELYRNPLVVILFTYMEILPVGLVISVITALILKKKKPDLQQSSPKAV